MDKELLGNLRTYSEVYEYVSKGARTKEELYQHLQAIGKARSTADEQVKKVFANQIQLLVVDGEQVSVDSSKAYSFVSEICDCFGLSVVCSPNTPKPEDEIRRLKEENEVLREELILATEQPVADAIINHMENSKISLESVELYTSEGTYKPFFLNDSSEKINAERVLSVQGGERDSIYRIIHDYEKDLTVENYMAKNVRKVFASDFLKRWVYALTHLEKIEKIKSKPKKTITYDELQEERVAYINEVLDNPNFSNQNKMTMYAALVRKDHKEIADLVEMAARYGLDARYTVQMFEESEWNKRRFISFIKSGMSQSEIRMKREVAREFIAGEWYVVAEYNGQRCRFQMVPMEELQMFLKLLKAEYYEEATDVLDKLINTKRRASFVNDDSEKELIVQDVAKNEERRINDKESNS